MAEISQAGYADLRNYVQDNWAYIGIKDLSGAAIMRVSNQNDSRCTWTHTPGAATLEVTTVLSGADLVAAGATLPIQIHTSAFYKEAIAGAQLTPDEPLTPADVIIATNEDVVTIKSRLQIPAQT